MNDRQRLASRCDRCNAAASFQAVLPPDGQRDLLFCTHHGNQFGKAMEAAGIAIVPMLPLAA